MKYNILFYTIAIVLYTSKAYTQNEIISGTIRVESEYTASVYFRPSQTLSANFSPNNFSVNIAVSIDATNLPIAPSISIVNNFITVNTTFIDNIENRWVYTLTGERSDLPNTTFVANQEYKIMDIIFDSSPVVATKFPRLADYADINGGPSFQSYFYTAVNGTDYTNYSDLFYGPIEGTTPSSTWVESAVPLPIKLRSFTAQRSGERDAQLRWISESEVNASHFQIERSADGKSWESIGRSEAAGDTDVPQNYSYLDDQVPLSLGRSVEQTFYYRLRMVDHDGWEEYSEIRSVRFSNLNDVAVSVSPNPFLGEFTLEVSAASLTVDQPMKLSIHTAHGQNISERYIYSSGKYPINMDSYQPGVYILTLSDGQFSRTEKIVKVQ